MGASCLAAMPGDTTGCKIETGGEGAVMSDLTAMGCKGSVVVFGAVTGIRVSVSDQSVIGIRTLRH